MDWITWVRFQYPHNEFMVNRGLAGWASGIVQFPSCYMTLMVGALVGAYFQLL